MRCWSLGATAHAALNGDLDRAGADVIGEEVEAILHSASPPNHLIIDLTGLTSIDEEGVLALDDACLRALEAGTSVQLLRGRRHNGRVEAR